MRPPLTHGLSLAAAVLALACGSKKEPSPAPGSASATAPAAAPSPAAAPTPAPSTPPAAPEATPAPPPSGGLPAECVEYRETIQRLARCGDALPQATRDNLRSHFEQQWAGWEKLPEQEKRTLAAICKRSAEDVKTAAAAGCGW